MLASSGRRGRTSVTWFKARRPTTSRSPITFQSALRESNPPRSAWKAGPLPIGQGHVKAEGEGVEPSRLIARPLSGRLPSPVGLTFRIQAAAAGIEPASGRLTAAYPYQHGSHRNQVRTAGFEPAISCARGTRNTRLSYVLHEKRPAGVEPALPPWQGGRLPLHHGRVKVCRIVKEPRAPGGTRTLVAALRVRCPCRWTTSAITLSGTRGT